MSSTRNRTSFDERAAPLGERYVVLHLHTYKNAGSTVDAILDACFKEGWGSFDFSDVPEFFIHHSEMANIARNRPQLKAISSHQARLPVPDFPGVTFLPIVFIRHPILRVASIWRFERSRSDDHPRTILARDRGFREWVRDSLGGPHVNAICNNQAWLFSFRMDKRTIRTEPKIFEFARRNFEALRFVGVVEEFEKSMRMFERIYQPKVPEFRYVSVEAKNTTQRSSSIEAQLAKVREEVGEEIYAEILDRNDEDMKLYSFARDRLADVEFGPIS